MAFRLELNEPVRDGIRRNVRHELERARKAVHDELVSPDPAVAREAVHEVRKRLKRVRAALRLMRGELGDDAYRALNYQLRDAARPLTQVRDPDMLVTTFDALAAQLAGRIDRNVRSQVRETLIANERAARVAVLGAAGTIAAIEHAIAAVLEEVDWPAARDDWTMFEAGVRRVYRAGHRALARALEQPTITNLHEWRKQAKYLWHELQLLEATWNGAEPELTDRVHDLSTVLGDDHDLAVLAQTLAVDPLAYGGHRALKPLVVAIDGRRAELQAHAFELGRSLYADSPSQFAERIARYGRRCENSRPVAAVGRSRRPPARRDLG
ncbi:MAG TPA: CHAD domain-containing protein [Kofleriaceae bacterium]|nr:CHAD domain-containing protein [Kofleriaceae bacterium]